MSRITAFAVLYLLLGTAQLPTPLYTSNNRYVNVQVAIYFALSADGKPISCFAAY